MQGLKLLSEGKCGKVFITQSVEKELGKFFSGDFRTLNGLKERCKKFANFGRGVFSGEQFKFEGKHSKGTVDGKVISVWAISFKQARLYGCLSSSEDLFIAGSCDKKQQNKANQEKLRKAAKVYAAYEKEVGNE